MEPCEVVIAVDLGGTRLKCGLVAADGAVLHRETRPTPRDEGGRAVLDTVVETVAELEQKAAADLHRVRGVGLVVPGIIDADLGIVRAENLAWLEMPVLAEVTAAVGPDRPVVLAHDVRAGGYAELRRGALTGATNALFLPLGTGIAAAMVVDGSLVSGDGYAGELGHTRFVHGDAAEQCACGQWGCLESVASAAALARRYGARTGRAVDGAREVLELVQAGDPDAAAVWADALTALVDALVLYITLVAPARIAIGGGLVGAGEMLLSPLRDGVAARLTFQRRPEIVAAELGDEAGCLGAALMAWDRIHAGDQQPDHQQPDHERPDLKRPDHERPDHERPDHESSGAG